MIGRIYAIAINTFREAVRDRVLYGAVSVGTVVLVFTLALAELSLEQEERVVLDVGLASISLFSVLVAVFLGSSLLFKEIERKTLYVILPRPIRRWEFLVGKFGGIVLTGAVFIIVMGAMQLWVTWIMAGASWPAASAVLSGLLIVLGLLMWKAPDRTAVLVPWSGLALLVTAVLCGAAGVDVQLVLASLALNVAEIAVVASVALFFSSFSTPFLTGVLTLGVWLIGRSAADMATMQSDSLPPELWILLRGISEVVPNFNLFVPGRHTLQSEALGGAWVYVLETGGYSLCYATLLLILASLIFRRRDFL